MFSQILLWSQDKRLHEVNILEASMCQKTTKFFLSLGGEQAGDYKGTKLPGGSKREGQRPMLILFAQ